MRIVHEMWKHALQITIPIKNHKMPEKWIKIQMQSGLRENLGKKREKKREKYR